MSIEWSMQRWDRVREDSERWWSRELKRPLVQIRTPQRPDRREPEIKGDPMPFYFDLSVPAGKIADKMDYDLSCRRYVGDAYPHVDPDMGPTIVAAYLGARAVNRGDTTWFLPEEEAEIIDLDFEYDPGNVWLRRHKEVAAACIERWSGLVQVSMPDFAGNLDIVAAFRPGEGLLLDLYDHPEEVKRLVWRVHELWWRYFDEFNAIYNGVNPGYTMPMAIFSAKPAFTLQCDFSYMISTEMFEEFAKPELAATCGRLARSFYHLDGPGALKHLDTLLEIDELDGVQWQFGAGQPGVTHWRDVFRRIREAGKLTHVSCTLGEFDELVGQLGSAEGIVLVTWTCEASEPEIREFLEKYGAAQVMERGGLG